MTPGGWIIMISSISTVTLSFIWCVCKVLKTPGETEHLRGIDVHTPDQEEDEK